MRIDQEHLPAQRHIVGQGLHQRVDHAARDEDPGGDHVEQRDIAGRDQQHTRA